MEQNILFAQKYEFSLSNLALAQGIQIKGGLSNRNHSILKRGRKNKNLFCKKIWRCQEDRICVFTPSMISILRACLNYHWYY